MSQTFISVISNSLIRKCSAIMRCLSKTSEVVPIKLDYNFAEFSWIGGVSIFQYCIFSSNCFFSIIFFPTFFVQWNFFFTIFILPLTDFNSPLADRWTGIMSILREKTEFALKLMNVKIDTEMFCTVLKCYKTAFAFSASLNFNYGSATFIYL